MKILHIGQGLMPAFARELSKLGGYRFVDWTQYVDMNAKYLLERDVLNITESMNPDITFLHLQRHGVIEPDFAKKLRGFIVNWTYDVVDPMPHWFYQLAPEIDLTLFCNDDDVESFEQHGFESDYLQIGFDEYVFKSEGTRGNHGEIVFLGNNYHQEMNYPLTNTRMDMVHFLKRTYGDRFKVYGNNWPYADGNFMYREQKEAECYRSCKIAINISHFDRRRYTSDRMFRIMGSGAFCLTKWYPEIERDFVDGSHLRVWRTFDELKELIDYYTQNEAERNEIAIRGMAHVRDNCTWAKRIQQFKDMAKARMTKEYKSRVVKVAQSFHTKERQAEPTVIPPTGEQTPQPIATPTPPPQPVASTVIAKNNTPVKKPLNSVKVGIVLIATGKYHSFIHQFIHTAEKFFLKDISKTYFLFTDFDYPSSNNVVVIKHEHRPWPFPTLYRYKTFHNNRDLFNNVDYLYYCDIDMRFVDHVGAEVLGDRVATLHPGYIGTRGTPEERPESLAYVSPDIPMRYFAGGFNGGKKDFFLDMCRQIDANIDNDYNRGVIAVWHDESHMNKFFIGNPPTIVLDPGYCYGEGMDLPYRKRLIALAKDHDKMRS